MSKDHERERVRVTDRDKEEDDGEDSGGQRTGACRMASAMDTEVRYRTADGELRGQCWDGSTRHCDRNK